MPLIPTVFNDIVEFKHTFKAFNGLLHTSADISRIRGETHPGFHAVVRRSYSCFGDADGQSGQSGAALDIGYATCVHDGFMLNEPISDIDPGYITRYGFSPTSNE